MEVAGQEAIGGEDQRPSADVGAEDQAEGGDQVEGGDGPDQPCRQADGGDHRADSGGVAEFLRRSAKEQQGDQEAACEVEGVVHLRSVAECRGLSNDGCVDGAARRAGAASPAFGYRAVGNPSAPPRVFQRDAVFSI